MKRIKKYNVLLAFLLLFSSFGFSKDFKDLYKQAKKLEKKEPRKAFLLYSEALRFSDNSWKNRADCFAKRGYMNYQNQRYMEALIDFKEAMSVEVENKIANKYAAECLFAMKRFKDAINQLDQAKEIIPKDAELDFLRGKILFFICRSTGESYQGNVMNSCINSFTLAIKKNKKYSQAFFYRGLANYLSGFEEEAVNDLKKTIKLDKKYYFAWFELAKIYLAKKFEIKSLEAVEKALEIKSDFYPALKLVLKLTHERKFIEKTNKYLKSGLEYYPLNINLRKLNRIYKVVPEDSLPVIKRRKKQKKQVVKPLKKEAVWLDLPEDENEKDRESEVLKIESQPLKTDKDAVILNDGNNKILFHSKEKQKSKQSQPMHKQIFGDDNWY